MSQARFQKMQREKARREKARAKAERKAQRAEDAEATTDDETAPTPPQDEVLAELAKLHQSFDDDQVDFDTFEERRQELLGQLEV